jgi:ubiquinone biosynthesis protein
MVILRLIHISCVLIFQAFSLLKYLFVGCFNKNNHTVHKWILREISLTCDYLGGAFPKVGQILATRNDLLSVDICRSLSSLQDQVTAISPNI